MSGPNRRLALGAVAGLAGLAAAAKAQGRDGLAGYAINLDTWCKQVPFEQRFPLARKLGFKTIEFWTVDRGNGTPASAIRKLMDDNGLAVTQFAPAWPNFADPAKILSFSRSPNRRSPTRKCWAARKFTITGHALVEGMSREASWPAIPPA